MIIELVEKILEEHRIFSYEYNKIGNYLSIKDSVKVSPHSRQLELIKITNAFISNDIIYKVDENFTIQIID